MVFDMVEYSAMMKERSLNIIYSGPLWEDGIKGIAEMVRTHLSHEDIPKFTAKSVFSVFIEQMTNMLMYSADKVMYTASDREPAELPAGTLVMGDKAGVFFIQTGNIIKKESVELIKSRIDYLNTLDKAQLRKYHKEQMGSENDNPESKGAGLGLIEIARRATAPISYEFRPVGENSIHFTMYVEIDQGKKEA